MSGGGGRDGSWRARGGRNVVNNAITAAPPKSPIHKIGPIGQTAAQAVCDIFAASRGAAMRVLLIPAVIVGVLAVTGPDEPTESAMRAAFETPLAAPGGRAR